MLKDILVQVGVIHGSRFNEYEKDTFRNYLFEELNERGIQFRMIRKGRARHILITPDRMIQKLLVVPYDTPARTLYPKLRYFPQSPEKNRAEIKKELIVRIVIAGIGIACSLFLIYIGLINHGHFLANILYGISVVVFVMTYYSLRVIGSKNNMSYCSASLALALSLIFDPDTQCSVVLIDNGFRDFDLEPVLSEIKEAYHPEILVLGPLATGDTVFISKAQNSIQTALAVRGICVQEIEDLNLAGTLFAGTEGSNICGIQRPWLHQDFQVDVKQLEVIKNALKEW